MRMRSIIKHVLSASHLLMCMMAVGWSSCTTNTWDGIQGEIEDSLCHTYAMHLNGSFRDFGQGTRAAHSWSDGSKLYLQFFENGTRITGTATFSVEDDTWTVKTSKALEAPDDAYCEAYYFVNPSAAMSTTVSLGLESVSYADKNGRYVMEEDDAIAVTASLSPLTGRIRFVGTPGAEYTISGMTSYTNYSVGANTFGSSSRKLSVTINADGSSDYFYTLFEDSPRLVVNGEGKSAYMRTFADHVLTAGSSGFVTLPSAGDLGAWALVNADNLQEITLPEVSAVSVSTIRSKSAGVAATVTALGNGTLLESGIVCSTNSTPTPDNGVCYDGNKSNSMSLRVKSLLPETSYYVRAYARNERGLAWGETVSFKTISEAEEGSAIWREGFSDDDDLNDSTSSAGSGFGKGGFGDDDDLNSSSSSAGSGFGKGGFGDDDDLNSSSSSTGSGFGKDSYDGNDDDLNNGISSTGSGFNKSGYDGDEDWN